MREYVGVMLKGAAMGVADTVPGVSGGTIALVAGIYDRLVAAIASLHPRPLRHLPYLHRREHRLHLREELAAMDLPFLIALGIGMVSAVIILARVIGGLIESYPGPTYAFFAGLILASAVILYRLVDIESIGHVALALLAMAAAFILSGIATAALGHSLPVVFVAGAIAVTALVLPGVSGAFLLLALGQYDYMIGVLNDFVDAVGAVVTGTGSTDSLLEAATPVSVFMVGAVIGVVTVAHAVNYALERARTATLIVLVSLMVGALRVPVAEVSATASTDPLWILATAVAGLLGAVAVIGFDYFTGDLEY